MMKMLLATFIGVTLATLCHGQMRNDTRSENPCRYDRSNGDVANLTRCLDRVRDVVYDDYPFFFGSRYEEECAGVDTLQCYNPFGDFGLSIGEILFNNENRLDFLDRYLHVTFRSEPLRYEGCGTRVRAPGAEIALDMSDEVYEPVFLRNTPHMRWDYEPGDHFTLIIMDVGVSFIHGFFTNIPGDDVESGDVFANYTMPLNFRFSPNAYIFLLFKQHDSNLELISPFREYVEQGAFFGQVDNFIAEYGLGGPVAVNVLPVSTDIYALERFREELPGIVENCVQFVQRAMYMHDEDFIPEGITLTAFLAVQFENDEDVEFFYCCEDHFYPARTVNADPIGDRLINASDVRTGSDVSVMITANGLNPTLRDWAGWSFVVGAVDADASSSAIGTGERPLLHYLAYDMHIRPRTNITGMLQGGRTLVEWHGPAPPPDNDPHRYYIFVLALENATFGRDEAVDLPSYVGDCEGDFAGRCLFDVVRFATDKNLHLLGMSWFRAVNDDYVNFSSDRPESEDTCGDRYPCPTPPPPEGASALQVSALLLAVSAAMAYFRL